MKNISLTQFFKDIKEFDRVPRSNRNKDDQRLGQWLCNKYNITADDDVHALFYRENFDDCYTLWLIYYVERKTNN